MNLYNQLLKSDFSSFIGKTLHSCDPDAPYLPNWHIDLIAEYLEAARKGKHNRLIINMPPRSLKSTLVSVCWPAWLMGNNPSKRIICASYSQQLSDKLSDLCSEVFPEVKIVNDQNKKNKYMVSGRGFRFGTSVGGTITGEGGDVLILL